jgi:hypothetical protein
MRRPAAKRIPAMAHPAQAAIVRRIVAQGLVAAMNTGSSVPPQAGLSASCEIRIDNNLSEISRVADMVDDFAARHQFADAVIFALNVALDEILNNIISYGYEDAGTSKRSWRTTASRLIRSRHRRPTSPARIANPAVWGCILCAI